jgi:hypothetical protein
MAIINPKDYGVEVAKAKDLTTGLDIVKAERNLLSKEFETISQLEITPKNIIKFKALRMKIVKNRTQGVDKWHKAKKEFFLTGGKFVDAIKRDENHVNQTMEEFLLNAEQHFDRIEKQRKDALHDERVAAVSPFMDVPADMDYSNLDKDVWESYLATKEKNYYDNLAAEKEAEEKRLALIKSQAEAQQKLRDENRRLLNIVDKIEGEKKQAELSKSDVDKRQSLISDLELLKSKYSFERKKNIKKYENVKILIDKIIKYI